MKSKRILRMLAIALVLAGGITFKAHYALGFLSLAGAFLLLYLHVISVD